MPVDFIETLFEGSLLFCLPSNLNAICLKHLQPCLLTLLRRCLIIPDGLYKGLRANIIGGPDHTDTVTQQVR